MDKSPGVGKRSLNRRISSIRNRRMSKGSEFDIQERLIDFTVVPSRFCYSDSENVSIQSTHSTELKTAAFPPA